MNEGKGTFKLSHKGNTGIIYIPAQIVLDSTFPLKEGKITIKIQNNHITITPKNEEKQ